METLKKNKKKEKQNTKLGCLQKVPNFCPEISSVGCLYEKLFLADKT